MFLCKDSYLAQMYSGMCSKIMFLLSCQLCDGDLEEKEKCVLAGRGQKTSHQDGRQGKQRRGDEMSAAERRVRPKRRMCGGR